MRLTSCQNVFGAYFSNANIFQSDYQSKVEGQERLNALVVPLADVLQTGFCEFQIELPTGICGSRGKRTYD